MADLTGNEATVKPDAPDTEAITDLLESLPMVVKESKAGYKTTEFWVTILASAATLLDVIPMPEHYKAIVVGVLGTAYTISRGIAKKGIPAVMPAPPA
jgi:hypothetical protein